MSKKSAKSLLSGLTIVTLLTVMSPATAAVSPPAADGDYGAAEARQIVKQPERWITADHGKFEKLQKDFKSGPEVTQACLSCHNEAGRQIRQTIHWTWICPADPTERMGKGGLTLNNF